MGDVIEEAGKVARDAVLKAGSILRNGFSSDYWVRRKSRGDMLTSMDLESEKIIKGLIGKAFPDHAILAEESGRSGKSEYLWIVDPLDGTTNYSVHNPFFATSVSMAFRGEVVIAATFAPLTGELFRAAKGRGAFLDNVETGKSSRMSVSGESDISNLLLSYCNGKSRDDKEEIARIFSVLKPLAGDFDRYKAGTLELAYVAAGRFGAYMANNQMAWDSAAGALLVREAGGKVTDFSGSPWTHESRDILATNGKIHEQLLAKLKEIRGS